MRVHPDRGIVTARISCENMATGKVAVIEVWLLDLAMVVHLLSPDLL